ncbi:bifunctional phosphoglucose/phosphomannose isomerase [Brevibacillus brevis]|uniref:Bifunctional phosphoglucose/phosphomannose isomerase n=1 Tax=Brevibacillus brevis TaxID=1393 RepID=A0A2Z4MR14_BREBE|nr:bifunctional phosphoglucose/phosphomannose isomerase [Brevibacillus brevis]AWX58995.1 bifunctional phosphoglucose/phosphomannose isomerase [Brevibacillus brevis]
MRINLNDAKALRELDTISALQDTESYDEQFKTGLKLSDSLDVSNISVKIENIVVLGTGGGSAASVNLIKSYLFDELQVPLQLNQGYTIPAFVDEKTLVIVVSHSGNTEEVVSGYEAAIAKGAQSAVITAGGKVLEMAREHNHACLLVPGGMMPRIVLGYIFLPILAILTKLGLISDKRAEVEETIALFEEWKHIYGTDSPIEKNEAKQIAIEMDGLIPVVYGTLPFFDAPAWRWKNQLGENSKLMAFWNAIPSLHHDEAVGWDSPSALLKGVHFTLIRDLEDSEKTTQRVEISADILRERAGGVRVVHSHGVSRMARLFSIVYLADFVSLYAALIRGVDPTPVEVINLFKQKMGQPLVTVQVR